MIFLLELRGHWPHNHKVLSFNMNIRLPLFWSTRSRARGLDSSTCAGLADASYSYCVASEHLDPQLFPEMSKLLKNMGLIKDVSNAQAQHCAHVGCWQPAAKGLQGMVTVRETSTPAPRHSSLRLVLRLWQSVSVDCYRQCLRWVEMLA